MVSSLGANRETVAPKCERGANLMGSGMHINGTMMIGMGVVWLLVLVFLIMGIAAFIRYLRSK